MKKGLLRKPIAGVLALSMALSLGVGSSTAFASAAAPGSAESSTASKQQLDYSPYDPGVTVVKDESSPTGYTAVFVFEEDSVVPSEYGLKDVEKVQVYSDGMFLFSYDEQKKGSALDPRQYAHVPGDFSLEDGILYPAGGDTSSDLYGGKKIAHYEDMTEFEEGKWGASIPLTSGATYYNYRLTDSEGTSDSSYIDDPANPTMVNAASGVKSRSSMVYVPYDAKKMGTGKWADRTVENPRKDGKTGTVKFAAYKGTQQTDRYLGIYLPYGYDADRKEPYNVLYMSHGAQSEATGCELRWLNECAAANIMDNLNGDFIVVTMNNTGLSDGNSWNFDEIWAEQELIMDYVETNYNVGTDAASRGFAGLSMGGMTASRMYAYHADQFGYIGIWSYADTNVLTKLSQKEKEALKAQDCKISVGAGDWDYLLGATETFADQLDDLGIDYEFLTVPGSHDWRTWQAIFAETVKHFFWKDFDYSGYDKGVTVEADANSPTGYTATFVYEEQDSYDGLTGEIAQVELYSDCFMHFDPEKGWYTTITPSLGHTPYEYEAGMVGAGGNGDTTCYIEMLEFAPGLWGAKVPLSSGAFVYNFRVTDEKGTQKSRLDDPNNPTLWNEATKIHSLSSMVYIPYNKEKMGSNQWADRSVELPQANSAKQGAVKTVAYTGAADDQRGLAVYLPAGYDANRSEPYKVLYLSHGTSGDQKGNELRWMNEGAVANIMDNLIAEGKAEPFVVVTMNNQDLGTGGPNWNYDQIWAEQELIMDYIEKNYNVCDTAEGRAYAGLSMGGWTASQMLLQHPDEFDYYGVWSYAASGESVGKAQEGKHIMLGCGVWDSLKKHVDAFGDALTDNKIAHSYYEVAAAHDWEAWQLLYAYAAEHFFWKDEDSGSAGSPQKPGASGLPFTDVAPGDWYYEAVKFVYENKLFGGVSDTSFGADVAMTRSALISVLYNMAGKPAVSGGTDFADVPESAGYHDAVIWAAQNNIVTGYSKNRFGSNDPATREQISLILYNYAKFKGYDVSQHSSLGDFADENRVSGWARDAVQWAVGVGLLSAKGNSQLSPAGQVSRAEVAQILMRFVKEIGG